MGKYLKEFELTSQYEEYINSTIAVLPNVSLVKEIPEVFYNPVIENDIKNYMKFTVSEGGTIRAYFIMGNDNDSTSPDMNYSYDGIVWQQWDFSELTLNAGQNLYFKGYNENGFSHPLHFVLDDIVDKEWGDIIKEGKFTVSGNIMSLLYGDDFEDKTTLPTEYCFYEMFYDNYYNLIDASNLILPATTLTDHCYDGMFQNCKILTGAPELPAATLVNGCYYYMFSGCENLNHITMLATDISTDGDDCLYNWVYRVSSTGTFVKHPNMTSLPSGENGIPEGWTVVDYAS